MATPYKSRGCGRRDFSLTSLPACFRCQRSDKTWFATQVRMDCLRSDPDRRSDFARGWWSCEGVRVIACFLLPVHSPSPADGARPASSRMLAPETPLREKTPTCRQARTAPRALTTSERRRRRSHLACLATTHARRPLSVALRVDNAALTTFQATGTRPTLSRSDTHRMPTLPSRHLRARSVTARVGSAEPGRDSVLIDRHELVRGAHSRLGWKSSTTYPTSADQLRPLHNLPSLARFG